jgi:hypothetical protein
VAARIGLDVTPFSNSLSSFPFVPVFSFFLFNCPALARAICSFLFERVHKTRSDFKNDYATNPKKQKTLHRFLVRFFRIKMHFDSVFGRPQKMAGATCTYSTLYAAAKNARFM